MKNKVDDAGPMIGLFCNPAFVNLLLPKELARSLLYHQADTDLLRPYEYSRRRQFVIQDKGIYILLALDLYG